MQQCTDELKLQDFLFSFHFAKKSPHFPLWKNKTTNIKKVLEKAAQQYLILNWSKCQQIYLNRYAQ